MRPNLERMKRIAIAVTAMVVLTSCSTVLAAEVAPHGAGATTTTLLAAGDIADCSETGDTKVANLLDTFPNTATIVTLGDNAYETGTLSQFNNCFRPTWGRHLSQIKPSPGNHDYYTTNAAGYFNYFGARAGPGTRGWYSYSRSGWLILALNSERNTQAGSSQLTWLKSVLAASNQSCVLAYWHVPRFARGDKSDDTSVKPFWDALYAARADVVLSGHDHNYQRYRPMTPLGAANANGIREFVVGTGGRHLYTLRPDSRRNAASDNTFGVLEMTLSPGKYSWRYKHVAGETYTDTGTDTCM